MHHNRQQNHEDRDVNERVIESRNKCQHEDETCRLQTLTLSSVDGVAKDDDYCVEEEQV